MSILTGLAREAVFNAVLPTQVVFQQPASRDWLNLSHYEPGALLGRSIITPTLHLALCGRRFSGDAYCAGRRINVPNGGSCRFNESVWP
ncbi:MAG TPA: hypothetical protein DEO91_12055 [Pseudomonas sp.]|nr:hypothetical protein [Pseudomonas sp.]